MLILTSGFSGLKLQNCQKNVLRQNFYTLIISWLTIR